VIEGSALSLARKQPKTTASSTVVILHSLSVSFEQLCARSPGAPSVDELRPRFCTYCGELAYVGGRVRVEGHGLYRRQVCGLSEGWIVVWVRRYLCRACGHTMSRLPDWLHPWRWYAATAIVEALYRYWILGETARQVGVRLGRRGETDRWQSLRRWGGQLLRLPTLWGWLGQRLGVKARGKTHEVRQDLSRFLGEIRMAWQAAAGVFDELAAAVRASLSDVVHNRRAAWLAAQFRPGGGRTIDSGTMSPVMPTKKGPRQEPSP
jgi:hypothetical protein